MLQVSVRESVSASASFRDSEFLVSAGILRSLSTELQYSQFYKLV